MPGAADHQVIVQGDADRGGGALDLAGHRDVGLRRRRVARRMVVEQTTDLPYAIDITRLLADTSFQEGGVWER